VEQEDFSNCIFFFPLEINIMKTFSDCGARGSVVG
jgi:hypothetical protein